MNRLLAILMSISIVACSKTASAQFVCGFLDEATVIFATSSPQHITLIMDMRLFSSIKDAEGGTDLLELCLRGSVRSIETTLSNHAFSDQPPHALRQEFDSEGNLERSTYILPARDADLAGKKKRLAQNERVTEFANVYEETPTGKRLSERTLTLTLTAGTRPMEVGKQTFAYDEKGRLIESVSQGTMPDRCCFKHTWTYDENGRLTARSQTNCLATESPAAQTYRFAPHGEMEAYCNQTPKGETACIELLRTESGAIEMRAPGGLMPPLSLTVDDRGNLIEWDSADSNGVVRMRQKITYDDHGNWILLEVEARARGGPQKGNWVPSRTVKRAIEYR